MTRPILTRVSREEAFAEIMASKDAIKGAVGQAPDLFAYPNGGSSDLDEAIERFLRDAGFRCAVTTLRGTNDTRMDPHELRRDGTWDPVLSRAPLGLAWNLFAA